MATHRHKEPVKILKSLLRDVEERIRNCIVNIESNNGSIPNDNCSCNGSHQGSGTVYTCNCADIKKGLIDLFNSFRKLFMVHVGCGPSPQYNMIFNTMFVPFIYYILNYIDNPECQDLPDARTAERAMYNATTYIINLYEHLLKFLDDYCKPNPNYNPNENSDDFDERRCLPLTVEDFFHNFPAPKRLVIGQPSNYNNPNTNLRYDIYTYGTFFKDIIVDMNNENLCLFDSYIKGRNPNWHLGNVDIVQLQHEYEGNI